MGKLIVKLKEMADVIIVDTPPILSCADAVSLGRLVDGFLVVAEWGRTDRSAFAEAVNLARQSGLRALGAVLNKVKPQSKGYYYHYLLLRLLREEALVEEVLPEAQEAPC
jgi:non-specific protein-tyrosine kinase